MITSLQGPLKYIQSAGIIKEFGNYAAELGSKAFILLTPGSLRRIGETLKKSLDEAGCVYEFFPFSGDVTLAEIERVASAAKESGCDLLVGIGGGRVMDTARAAADIISARLIIVPTTASNDAPCSAVAVIHDEKGKTIEIRTVRRNPDLVLVDTQIIAEAPAGYLSAGMGDALATYFEARANCRRQKQENGGLFSTRTALAMSRLCYDILLEFGPEAMESVKESRVSYALEQVVHAAIFLSGYGFENGGVAAAHATNEGFSLLPRCSKILHGDLVGFGVLVQLELENAPAEEKKALREFMASVGLSTGLKELGLDDISEEELFMVAEAACSVPPMKNMPFAVSRDDVYRAILAADHGD